MKNLKYYYSIITALVAFIILVTISCSRDDEELVLATFSTNPEVYIDGFSGGLDYFPFDGSKLDAFTVDTETKYKGSSSMRFDIPNAGDPEGAYAGAIFPDNTGRDLTGYDALTFWAKGTQAGTINEMGFGNDFGENKYVVTLPNLQLTTNWKKYTIPIPDASKLTRERGLLWYSEGPEDGKGYTFWLDEVQYEDLGTIGQPRPEIAGGEDITLESFIGVESPVTALRQKVNLVSGIDQTVNVSPAYFEFISSNPGVATVSELGIITVVGAGSSKITATLNGVEAKGSVTVNSIGNFSFAPTPSRDPAEVISIFSDAYDNIPVDYYNGFWQFSSTQGGDVLEINGDNLIVYSELNFVGIQFATSVPTIDASQMTHLHVDIFTTDNLEPGDFLRIGLNDVGADNSFGGGDDSGQELTFTAPQLVSGQWVSLDIPLSDFTGLTRRMNLAQVIFVSDLTIPSITVDNIYLYRDEGGTGTLTEPDQAAPAPVQNAGDVISLFSDEYDDVPVDTWRTDWSSANFEDITIAGNATKKYSGLDFVGIETVSNQVDASNMTHFHMDVWSADYTVFGIKLVDFGVDGAFDGGDDVEHQINIDMPAQGQWVSLDLPLADFVGLTTRGHIAQYILVGQPSGANTVYVDNVYFYGDGGGTGTLTEPDQAAPAPTQNAGDVISLFSDEYDDVSVDTWRTDWSSAAFEDITIAGNATKKYSELDFVGIETVSNPVDASSMTHFRIDVWSADFTLFGIKLVDFGPDGSFGGGDDAEHQINIDMPAQGQWVSLDLPLTDFTGLTTTGHIAQYILVGQPSGASTVFADNVYFYNDGSGTGALTEPDQAAPTPTQNADDVVSLFSDAYMDVPVDTWRTDWSSAAFEDITIAGDATKKYSALDFVGIETVSNPVDASSMTHFRIDVWSADFTLFGIKLVDFGPDGAFGGGDDAEHQINIDMPGQGQWVSLDIPLADFTGLTTTGHIAQYILVGQPSGANTVFVDNVYFYNDGSGTGALTEPDQAAPTPAQNAADVVSLFSDAYMDVPVDTWRTDWSSAAFEDITIAGDATKKYSALDFVGIETVSNPVDASSMTHFRIDVWSADFTLFGIKLVDFGADGAFGGGDDTEHQINIDMPTQGQWVSLDIPLADFTGLTTTGHIAQYILVGQPSGANTVFVDNVYFYNDGSGTGALTEPDQAAPTPAQNAADVVSLFSDAYMDVPVDTWRTDWSSAAFEDITIAGDATKKYSALDFVGIETVSNPVDASSMTHFRIDVWSADFTLFGIKLVDFGADGAFGGGDDTEHQINIDMPTQGQWVSLDIPLADFAGLTTTGHIAQYILVGQPSGANTVFVDNVYFYNDGSGTGALTEPDQAAPTPTQNAADVVSLFSDAYMDVPVDTWRTDWSSATFEDITVAGDATKKYSALDFVGIETVSNQVDASSMTHFRIDVWSADFTLFGIKLVDFGPDGAFGGGDDAEHQINIDMPAQGQWVSLDIPLADFAGLTTTGHIAQYIIVGQPTGATSVYVDNVYFHK